MVPISRLGKGVSGPAECCQRGRCAQGCAHAHTRGDMRVEACACGHAHVVCTLRHIHVSARTRAHEHSWPRAPPAGSKTPSGPRSICTVNPETVSAGSWTGTKCEECAERAALPRPAGPWQPGHFPSTTELRLVCVQSTVWWGDRVALGGDGIFISSSVS